MSARQIFKLTGSDVDSFLQGLVTNDITRLKDGLVYAALLTPQGKYIADFFLLRRDDAVLLDVDAALADALAMRLTMYKLRADVTLTKTELSLHRGLSDAPSDGFDDPRAAALGWRAYRDHPQASDTPAPTDWDALRVAHCIPQSGIELGPDIFILEAGFERLHGVDFRKGCYVGQEITARMKHKTELRKGFVSVAIDGTVPVGTSITRDGKAVGTVFTQSGGQAIAFLRFDRAGDGMVAADASITWSAP